MAKISEKEITKMMQNLRCSREEAIQVIEDDRAIDQGKKMDFDLDPELEKEVRKSLAKNTKQPKTYEFKPRERKPNEEKREIIAGLAQFLATFGVDSLETTNIEREITFSIGENNYSVTLIQHRQPKN